MSLENQTFECAPRSLAMNNNRARQRINTHNCELFVSNAICDSPISDNLIFANIYTGSQITNKSESVQIIRFSLVFCILFDKNQMVIWKFTEYTEWNIKINPTQTMCLTNRTYYY